MSSDVVLRGISDFPEDLQLAVVDWKSRVVATSPDRLHYFAYLFRTEEWVEQRKKENVSGDVITESCGRIILY